MQPYDTHGSSRIITPARRELSPKTCKATPLSPKTREATPVAYNPPPVHPLYVSFQQVQHPATDN